MDLKHRPTKRFACPLILASRQKNADCLHYMLSCGASPNYVHRTVRAGDRGQVADRGQEKDDPTQNSTDKKAKQTETPKNKSESLTPLQVGQCKTRSV